MTLTKVQQGPEKDKRGWTAFELILLAPFVLLFIYIATEPLVLSEQAIQSPAPLAVMPMQTAQAAQAGEAEKAGAPVQSSEPAQDAAPALAPAMQPEQPADEIRAVFVSTGTTVLQRIAPIASVTIETPEVPAEATADPAPAVSPTAPLTAATAGTAGTASTEVTASAQAVPPAAPAATAQQGTALRLEITDGTGVDGIAKSVAQSLEESGLTISKTSNVPAGKQRRTVILYRDGFEAEAVRVSKLFNRPPSLVNNTHARNSSDASDVRVVLGSAAAHDKALLVSKRKGGASGL